MTVLSQAAPAHAALGRVAFGLAWIDGFVHPALAAGAALAAVPLVIHLLNRQRHRPMPWAAMRFVLSAYRRTRRRAQFENLLLLLLRMAAVALLALAVARPFVGRSSPLAGLTERRRDLVLVLDGSYSTGLRGPVHTVFEDIVERARALTSDLDGGRGDRVRLILAGAHPRLLSWRSPEEAFGLLSTLTQPTDERLDLAASLGEVLRFAEEDAASGDLSSLDVRLLTDLQRNSFSFEGERAAASAGAPADGANPAGKEPPRAAEMLDRLRGLGLRVWVEDLGGGEVTPPNVAVAAIDVEGPLLGAGVPTEVSVTLVNHGLQDVVGARVALEVDGERRPIRLLDVPARERARARFDVTFATSGTHTLVARAEPDRLPADDARAQVVAVPPPVRVLLVDGEPAFDVEKDEIGMLRAVLEPLLSDAPGADAAPFLVRTVEPAQMRQSDLDLDTFDLLVLANVTSVDAATIERLESRVARGGALWITAGKNLDAGSANWNARLFRADGSGLLPAELFGKIAVPDRRRDWFRVREFREDHPVLSFFADERWKPLLTEVPIYEFLSARPLADARVLARLDDEAKSPLLIERDYDRGKVLLWLTSIDAEWARVCESPRTLVPLVHELARYAGTPPSARRNMGVGERYDGELASYPRAPVLLRPDGSRRPLSGEPRALAADRWSLPPIEDTDRAGVYRIESEGAPALEFAIGLDPAEGDLERANPDELAALHPALVPARAEPQGQRGEDESDGSRGEMWRLAALAALLALVAEALWAGWLGHKRSR